MTYSKSRLTKLIATSLICFSTASHAGWATQIDFNSDSTEISHMTDPTDINSKVHYFAVTNHTNAPACATSNRFATKDDTTLNTILTAKALNKEYRIKGTGTCDIAADAESIQNVRIVF